MMNQIRTILQNYIDQQHGGVTSRAARALGFKDSSLLAQWINGTRSPSMTALIPVLERLGIRLQLPDMDMESYALIPKVEARAGAGSSLLTSSEIEEYQVFSRIFLSRLGVNPNSAVMLDVMGTSMEPLICHGDTILVDQVNREPRDNQIFLIGLEDELMVKRLQKIPGGWNIHSENPQVQDVPVTGVDLDAFRVYGRVRWYGRIL